MGYDGGEVGRRMAAEDEYIRRELAETTAFCNAFWVSGRWHMYALSLSRRSSGLATRALWALALAPIVSALPLAHETDV